MINEEEARDILRFQMNYNKSQIKATWALAFVIIVYFLLEEYFGGSTNLSVLVRMGANVSLRVQEGEYFRLFSAVFLHSGWLHIFFNTYVLFALGGFFNRILGEARFLSVFLFSGICGSLASVFLGKSSVSVGASGAIWGLFGASLALAIFKTPLLPEAIRLNLRRVTLINLLINLGVSFLPMIDFWAHIGGGIGGLLMGLLIVLSSQNDRLYRLSNYLFGLASIVLVLLYAYSLAYSFWAYKPWQDQLKNPLVEKSLSSVGFVIKVPSGLKEEAPNKNSFVFGEPGLDSLVVEVSFFKQDMLGEKIDDNWLKAQREELLKENALLCRS